MSDKKPENNDGLLEIIKNLWLPVAGFLGAITLAYNFYQLWLGDQETVTWFLTVGGMAVLIVLLFFIIFRKKHIKIAGFLPFDAPRIEVSYYYPKHLRKISLLFIAVIFISASLAGYFLFEHRKEQQEKFVVAIALFDGPEDVYGLRNEIIESLQFEFLSDATIEILPLNKTISPDQGSEFARNFGKRYLADIVIWGWYRPTDNPNITIHIENIVSFNQLPIEERQLIKPTATIADLESFTVQQQVGRDINALVLFLAGSIALEAEDFESALTYFDSSLENVSPNTTTVDLATIHFRRGHVFLSQGNYPLAIETYNEIINVKGKSSSVLINRGVAYAYLEKYELAAQDLSDAIIISADEAIAHQNRGLVYEYMRQYDKAIIDYTRAIELSPEEPIAYLYRGGVLANIGEFERAILDFDMAIQLDPNIPSAYYNRGKAYGILGDVEHELQDYNKTIQIDPEFVWAYTNLGVVYFQLGDYAPAISNFSTAIMLDSENSLNYFNRGLAYSLSGDHKNAISDFTVVIKLEPNNAGAYVNRGLAYGSIGDHEMAISDFTSSILIDASLAQAYYNRGIAYLNIGKGDKAELDFDKYEELTGGNAP